MHRHARQAAAPTVTPSPTGGGQTVKSRGRRVRQGQLRQRARVGRCPCSGRPPTVPTTIDGRHTSHVELDCGDRRRRLPRVPRGWRTAEVLEGRDVGDVHERQRQPAPTADGPENPASNPRLHNCSYTNFDSVKIRIDVSQGHFTGGGDLDCAGAPPGTSASSKSVPLDIGIPGSVVAVPQRRGPDRRDRSGTCTSRSASVAATASSSTRPTKERRPNSRSGLNFRIPGDLEAELAFINITAHNCTNSGADQTLGCGADSRPAQSRRCSAAASPSTSRAPTRAAA